MDTSSLPAWPNKTVLRSGCGKKMIGLAVAVLILQAVLALAVIGGVALIIKAVFF